MFDPEVISQVATVQTGDNRRRDPVIALLEDLRHHLADSSVSPTARCLTARIAISSALDRLRGGEAQGQLSGIGEGEK